MAASAAGREARASPRVCLYMLIRVRREVGVLMIERLNDALYIFLLTPNKPQMEMQGRRITSRRIYLVFGFHGHSSSVTMCRL